MNKPIFESTLFVILVVNILRSEVLKLNFFSQYFILILVAISVTAFILLSFAQHFKLKIKNSQRLRILLVFLTAILIYSVSLKESISIRQKLGDDTVHDGVVQIEHATMSFLKGENPYLISYKDAFVNRKTEPEGAVYERFVYSPISFVINIPAYLLSSFLNFFDLRLTLFLFLFLSSIAGLMIVGEKMIFLLMFLFNPLFTPFLVYGANEIIVLSFIFFSILFLYKNRLTPATLMLSLALGTKLLALPLVPLYFIYLWQITKKSELVFKQIVIFTITTLAIYLPFALGNFGEFFADLFFTHLKGGAREYEIVGFLGVPQLLSKLNLISVDSEVPFYLPMILASFAVILPLYFLIKKVPRIDTLILVYVLYFCAIFTFSRIFHTTFVAYLSQLLVLASLVSSKNDHS